MNPPPPRSTRTDALLPCPTRFRSLSVLVTVIGHRPAQGHVIVDGGWMARSRDRGTQDQPVDQGYGLALDLDQRPLGDVVMIAASQEHGVLARRGDGALDLGDYPVGRRLRILPNPACATAAQPPAYAPVSGETVPDPRTAAARDGKGGGRKCR